MEQLLEIACSDGSEKQYDTLPAVSPAEAAQMWPTFSAEHDNMEVELYSLVKCTFQGIVATNPLSNILFCIKFI